MKKKLNLFWLSICCFFILGSYAAGIGTVSSVSVQVTSHDGTSTGNKPADAYTLSTANNLSTIAFTLNGISNLVITDNSTSPTYGTNWGIYFGSTFPPTIFCSVSTCWNTSVTFIIGTNVPTVTSSNASGSLTVTLDFSGNNYQAPGDLASLLNSGSVPVGVLYNAGTANGGISYGATATWPAVPDLGTLINAPILQANNTSVAADVNSFHVTAGPPTDLSAVCPAATAAGTCMQDGTGATTLISTPLANVVSGYVVGFWKDTECRVGGFTFSPNWMAYNYVANTNYTCTYTPYQTSFNTGGTSSILGCSFSTSPVSFLTGVIAPTAETAAIPYITTDPKQDLKNMINNPGSVYKGTDSCISYVYLSSSGNSSSTFTTGHINNGDVYGVVVWALNSASDSTYSIPNYSLAHSNVFYTTGINFQLASISKNGQLTRSKDCFVVTAASDNLDSASVYYWRILRDTYLTPIGITSFYYKHAKVWANWLDEHPSLKPSLNFIFEKTGYIAYNLSEFISNVSFNTKEKFHKFINYTSTLFENKASAQELTQIHLSTAKYLAFEQNAVNSKNNFGLDKDSDQQNIDVIPEDLKNDPFFTGNVNQKVASTRPPPYEVALTGGILIPTKDKAYYDAFYSSQPSFHGELAISRIFWGGNIGYLLGIEGRYLTNRQEDTVNVLGNSTQHYTRTFYAVSAETILGMRYRNLNFLYLQPGIFVGAGVTRFREDATVEGNTSSNSGVTSYSPIYEAGVSLDLSLSKITGDSDKQKDDIINDILFRLSGSYNMNPTNTLSSTGYFVQAGFAFLLN